MAGRLLRGYLLEQGKGGTAMITNAQAAAAAASIAIQGVTSSRDMTRGEMWDEWFEHILTKIEEVDQ
jgi:hypothetical protein